MAPLSPVSEPGPAQAPGASAATAAAADSTLAAWQARGAHRFDPVRFRVIEALARRAVGHEGGARQLLDRKLATLLAAYGERFEEARTVAGETLAGLLVRHPAAADALRRCHAEGDFKGLCRLAATLDAAGPAGPLADLVCHIDRSWPVPAAAPAPAGAAAPAGRSVGPSSGPSFGTSVGPPAELRALRYFRRSWARLSVDQQLTRSLARAPEQAGPLNSQRLVLRSLTLMRDVSPAYLSRFMSYVDALMWLDQAASAGAVASTSPARGAADKQRKPGRGRSC